MPGRGWKLRCPLVETSLTLSFSRPSVTKPPSSAPRCCRQASITVPPNVNDKTRQKHPYPSPVHRRSYARRTAAERAYARLADPAGEGVRQGWCRLFGTAKNALMYSLGAVAHNIRIEESRERQEAGRSPSSRIWDLRLQPKTPPARSRAAERGCPERRSRSSGLAPPTSTPPRGVIEQIQGTRPDSPRPVPTSRRAANHFGTAPES